jgi:Predicted membrane protein
MNDRTKQIIGTTSRYIIGAVFVLSAVLKLLSIDAVDDFLFSHQVFSLDVTSILARLLICAEAVVGLMLLLGIMPRLTRAFTFIFLVLFTIYVSLKPYIFDVGSENCYCFGTAFELSDTQTLVKNAIMLLLSLTLWWSWWWKTKFSAWIFSAFIVLSITTVFVVKPPDIIRTKIYKRQYTTTINEQVFAKVLEFDNVKALKVSEGKKVICMYGAGCKYCKRAVNILQTIRQKHSLPKEAFVQLFLGKEDKIQKFYRTTHSEPLAHTTINLVAFINTTNGHMPVIILLDKGKIVQLYNLRTIDEQFIASFLKQ